MNGPRRKRARKVHHFVFVQRSCRSNRTIVQLSRHSAFHIASQVRASRIANRMPRPRARSAQARKMETTTAAQGEALLELDASRWSGPPVKREESLLPW